MLCFFYTIGGFVIFDVYREQTKFRI